MSETTTDELHGIAFDPEELRMAFATAEALDVAVTVTDEHAAFEEIIEVAQRGVSFGCDRDRWELDWQIYKAIVTGRAVAEKFDGKGWLEAASPSEALVAIKNFRKFREYDDYDNRARRRPIRPRQGPLDDGEAVDA